MGVIAITAALLLLRKRRKARQLTNTNPGNTAGSRSEYHKAELPGDGMGAERVEKAPGSHHVGGGGHETREVHELEGYR